MPVSEFSDVFVSYRRKDVDFVKELVEKLQQEGKEVWIDWEDIPPGSVGFTDDIRRGLEGADAFLAVLSPDYLESPYCVDMELNYAASLNKKLIPIVYRKFDDQPAPVCISHINWIYFTPHAGQSNTFDQSFPKILDALDTDLEHVRMHKRFAVRALEWEKHNRLASYLLTGDEILQAETWLSNAAGKTPLPTELHKEYIADSRRAHSRRQRMMLTGVSVALVVSAVLAILSLIGFQRATVAEATAITNFNEASAARATAEANLMTAWQSQALFYGDLAKQASTQGASQSALLVALHALTHYEAGIFSDTAFNVVSKALRQNVRLDKFFPADNKTMQMLANEAGSQIMMWSDDSMQIIDAATGDILVTFAAPAGDNISMTAWSPDGTRVSVNIFAAAEGQTKLHLLDAQTGETIAVFDQPEPLPLEDATTAADGTQISFDAETGAMSMEMTGDPAFVAAVDGLGVDMTNAGEAYVYWNGDDAAVRTYREGTSRIEIINSVTGEVNSSQTIAGRNMDMWWSGENFVTVIYEPLAYRFMTVNARETLWSEKFPMTMTSHVTSRVQDVMAITLNSLEGETVTYEARVLDTISGDTLFSYETTDEIQTVALNTDATTLAINTVNAEGGYTITSFDLKSGEQLGQVALEGRVNPVYQMTWYGDSLYVSESGLWDAELKGLLLELSASSSLIASPDNKYLISLETNYNTMLNNLNIYEAATGELVLQQPDINGYPSLIWSPDNTRFVFPAEDLVYLGGVDGTLTSFQAAAWVTGLQWSPDGSRLLVLDNHASIYEGTTLVSVLPHDTAPLNVLWLTDDRITTSRNGGIEQWDLTWQPTLLQVKNAQNARWLGDRIAFWGVAYDETEMRNIGQLEVREADQTVYKLELPDLDYQGVVWNSDNSAFYTLQNEVTQDGMIENKMTVWDGATAEKRFEQHLGVGAGLVWSPDGQKLAVWVPSVDNSAITVFNSTTGDVLSTGNDSAYGLTWSNDSQHYIVIPSGQIFDAAAGELVGAVGEEIASASWSPDSQFTYIIPYANAPTVIDTTGKKVFEAPLQMGTLLSNWNGQYLNLIGTNAEGNDEVIIWDSATGESTHYPFNPPIAIDYIYATLWTNDNQWLVYAESPRIPTGSNWGTTLNLYHLESGENRRIDHVTWNYKTLQWNPDQTRLLTSTEYGSVKVWDTATWTPVHNVMIDITDNNTSDYMSAAFHADETRLLTWDYTNGLREWVLDYPALISEAQSVVVRDLTVSEREKFFLPPVE